jgi:1-acyl-sn-glycerol-3-phosphate acyltransferase
MPVPDSDDDLGRFREALARRSFRQGRMERLLRRLIRTGAWLAGWQLEVEGMEALPRDPGRPAAAGCIVAPAPHRAWLEPFLLLWAWPSDAARLVWLADGRTATRSRWRRWLLPRIGIIPIARGAGGPRAYAELAARVLDAGAAVVVFPEVGPPSEPARTRRISAGFSYLARRAGAPVIPVVIGGTHHIVRGSSFSLQALDPLDGGVADPDPFGSAVRTEVHELAERYAHVLNERLPAHTARADRLAPPRDRWTWLARLFS